MTSRAEFLRALSSVEFTTGSAEVRRHLLALLESDDVDWQQLARPCASLLLDADGQSELLHAYLRRCINVSLALERRLTSLRREALTGSANVSPRLVESLAIQSFLNAYIWEVTDEEEAALRDGVRSPASSVITAAYRPLDAEAAEREPFSGCRDLLRVLIEEPEEERLLSGVLAGDVGADVTTAAVRAQYEEHPFPRWLSLNRPEPAGPERRLNVLVAGCGTGMHAIRLALRHPSWHVDAIDISRRSLGYAMRKARELGASNVTLRLQDLRRVDGAYDVVHSGGVLHHTPDPVEALRALARCVTTGGELHVAVYSRRGRASLARLRELAGPAAMTAGSLRRARQRLFSALDAAEAARLEHLDFFELGHFRDTLYHAHERTFTPPELDELVRAAGLVFTGFEDLPPHVLEEHGGERDLAVWDRIECDSPDLFQSMFRMTLRTR